MVNSLENIDKSKVYVDRIEGLDEVVEEVVDNTLIGAVSTITKNDLTAGKVLVSDNNGKVATSSKGISDLQDALVSGTNIKTINETSLLGSGNIAIESGANTSLSNLSSQGQNITNWSTNVTNCITEIPQDIKLELNNGTLTLKAGSKIYVPNGAGVFDEVTISSDFSVTSTTNAQEFILLAPSRTSITHFNKNFCSSEPTQPTVTTTYWMWYDTTNNKIKFTSNSGASWVEGFSLPLGLSTSTSSGITSIDQVFNGFGYFGKHNFITNVKFLIAKGYNTDGTYHNQEYIINSPIVARNYLENNSIMFFRYNKGNYQIYNILKRYYLGELNYVPDIIAHFQWYYNTTNRMWYMHEQDEQAWRQVDYANIGINTSTETNFKEVFRAVDYDDLATVATSGSYNDLTNKPTIPSARNIGQIIQSTIPLTDAGLHLLDGSLISGDGIYSDFYNYMVQIHNNYPHLFCTETEWQQYVATDGACNRFVLDTTNKTIRLGLLTGFIEGTNSLSDLGALTAAGLPNITATGQIGTRYDQGTPTISGAFVNLRHGGIGSDEPNTTGWLYDLDASYSSSIYGRSSTVQPQSIKVMYYICIATSIKTDIQVDIDEIATDLNGKADVDLSNINTSGKSFASGLAMPSSRYIDLTLGASSASYTAPANGYFCFNGKDSSNTGTAEVVIRNQTRYFGVAGTKNSTLAPSWAGYILPAKKGDIVYLYYIGTLALDNTNWSWRFYYAEGEA